MGLDLYHERAVSTQGGWGKSLARQLFAAIACSVAGHHYLKGAKGARPNLKDGAFCRPGNVTLSKEKSLDKLAFYAATAAFDNTPKPTDDDPNPTKTTLTYVCGGNYARIGNSAFVPGTDLANYLKDQVPSDPGRCYTRAGQTPRRVQEGGKSSPYVWGQSCDGWRHFDCLGLVDFAIWKMRNGQDANTRSVVQWASPSNQVGAKRMGIDDDPLDGDLVAVGDHHIGIIYLAQGKPYVVQAEQTSQGVTLATPYDAANWTGGRWRLPDSLFIEDDAAASVDLPDTGVTPVGILYAK